MSLKVRDIAPNFKATTTEGEIISMITWAMAGVFYFLTRLIIHRYVPQNWARLLY